MHHFELKVPPAALWASFAATIVLLASVAPIANFPFPGHRVISIAFLLWGGLIFAAGVLEFRRAKTTVNPLTPHTASSIVTSGIYRYTRNPMYLGMAIALAGSALWRVNLLGLLLVPVFCAFISRFQIKPEERALIASFGNEFAAYMARVRRWI